jgi:hypothetical protein
MDFHGVTMQGDFETDNVKAKNATGIEFYDDSDILTFNVLDGGYIKAYIGASINEFSTDATMGGDSPTDIALCTEKAIHTYVNNTFQPINTYLSQLSDLAPDERNFIVGDGSSWGVQRDATARASLGLGSAATRNSEDTLTNGSNLPDGEAITTFCGLTYLAKSNNLSDVDSASTARGNLGVAIGSDVQAWDADLDAIAGLSKTDSNFIVGSGSTWVAESGATARESLGLTGNSNTTHYHDGRYYQQSEFSDGSTIAANILRLKVSGTTKTDGYLYAGSTDPTNTTRLNYDGEFYATKVHNAVYNDIADFRFLDDELVYGKCYMDTKTGAKICDKRCQMGVIGIASDTFGFSCGTNNNENQVPIAVSGWVLAYVDSEYEIGTPLTNNEHGVLTRMEMEEKRNYPERIVAIYSKRESNNLWNGIDVNGRHWVKIK